MNTRKQTFRYWNLPEIVAFFAFLIWSAAGIAFILLKVTPETVPHWNLPDLLTRFIDFCLQEGDPILIVLAFANSHLHAGSQWSSPVARNWAVIVILLSYGVEYLGVRTGLPFGVYHYTERLGPMLWQVPLVIPLAWHVVLTNALFVVRAVAPYLSQFLEAAATGVLCMLYDAILEPFAMAKHYWEWAGGEVAPLNYVAWLIVSMVLIRLFGPTYTSRSRWDPRPWLILAITIAIFLVGQFTPA